MSRRFVVPSASLLLELAACAPELVPLSGSAGDAPESTISVVAGPDPDDDPLA